MTNSEIKKKITESSHVDWYNNLVVNLSFKCKGSKSFKGLSAIYEYVNQQCSGWSKVSENLHPELQKSKVYFETAKTKIINFVNSNLSNNLDYYWNNDTGRHLNTSNQFLQYDIPEVDFLITIHSSKPSYFNGAFSLLVNESSDLRNKDNLYGAILAYEFSLKDHTELSNRRNAEKQSISRIRNDFQNYLNESEQTLLEHLKKINDKYEESVQTIAQLKDEKNTSFNEWFEHIKTKKWDEWYNPCVNNIKELESTYKEKLKLEEPAKYWSERAKKLKNQGWICLIVLIVLVLITCWSLGEILWKTPEQIYSSWFENDKSAAIRWSVVYITLVTFITFCIRAVSKVMFSSFHLARDCEERYTLTYFYLALLKDSDINDNDRQLIMQSLFSRAETGLLKDDSSPTMPNDMISKIITK